MRHFSHPHDLHLVQLSRENTQTTCSGCEVHLFGACYTCSGCNYFLHKSCFELPQYTTHQAHPHHTLTLLYPPYSTGACNSCAGPCATSFTYGCSACGFSVHASCLRLDQAVGRDDHEQYFLTCLRQLIAEVKPLVAQISATGAGGVSNAAAGAQPAGPSEWDLQRMRDQMAMQQIKRASDSIDFLGQIGSSSYKVEYKYIG